MILRLINFIVIGALVVAAAYVYRIKFDATVQAERLAKLRSEVRHERDDIAALRAEWGQLDNPARIEALAQHYLRLRPIAPTQFDPLDRLPERPPNVIAADSKDPIGGIIENLEPAGVIEATGSIPVPAAASDSGDAMGPAGASPDRQRGAPQQ